VASNSQITILYDAFGTDPSMTKDWGFSALVEIAGKRILFDTGNDAEMFAANVKAKDVDLKTLDFVVLSHRHSDHVAGLNYVLSVNAHRSIGADNSHAVDSDIGNSTAHGSSPACRGESSKRGRPLMHSVRTRRAS
jgi:metal-dependent hydrolase (beta-lactamase superfamily II)